MTLLDLATAVTSVAAVAVDTGLAHLDRLFEYSVPPQLQDSAQPGVRVKVRFAGRDVDGFVIERRAQAEHGGRLTPLRKVVSDEPVLTAEVLGLARAVADRYAGTLGDVLRLAVPKRHAAAEKALPMNPPDAGGAEPASSSDAAACADEAQPSSTTDPWQDYPAGPALIRRLGAREPVAASWLCLPSRPQGSDWPDAIAAAAAATVAAGRGVLVVVPDHRDVDRVSQAFDERLGRSQYVRLTADQGPQARYTAWLKVLRAHVRVVVGTRASVFAPVPDLGLVVCWDDVDDLHEEPRAPYPHVREVLRIRAQREQAALLMGGFVRSVEVASWLAAGVVQPVEAHGSRLQGPIVRIAGEGADIERDGPAARAHLPSAGWRAAQAALAHGPVLIQVPRRGYASSLSCTECRAPVRCAHCQGPLAVPHRDAAPVCRWCGTQAMGFRCVQCDGNRWRVSVIGSRRTAEDLGRAFPGVPVVTSGAGEVVSTVGPAPALVIATPGAEPVAQQHYAAALLLDAWALTDLPSAQGEVEALRRWCAAAALVRRGGAVVLGGVPEGPALPAVEALVRWRPEWLAERVMAERVALGLPPAAHLGAVTGARRAVARSAQELRQSAPGLEQLGPVRLGGPVGDGDDLWRLLVRAASADAVARPLATLRATRSARKDPEPLVIRVDPDPVG